jgi:hypothetical protein
MTSSKVAGAAVVVMCAAAAWTFTSADDQPVEMPRAATVARDASSVEQIDAAALLRRVDVGERKVRRDTGRYTKDVSRVAAGSPLIAADAKRAQLRLYVSGDGRSYLAFANSVENGAEVVRTFGRTPEGEKVTAVDRAADEVR